ncbi:6801_t:CDS:2, partial [Paraglomus brasilianum]
MKFLLLRANCIPGFQRHCRANPIKPTRNSFSNALNILHTRPPLKKFLDFWLSLSDLEAENGKYDPYKGDLIIFNNYYAKLSEIEQKACSPIRSRRKWYFWEQQTKRRNLLIKTSLREEKDDHIKEHAEVATQVKHESSDFSTILSQRLGRI